jgi:ABC-type multidrug transport system fused ATPase/permease subunit
MQASRIALEIQTAQGAERANRTHLYGWAWRELRGYVRSGKPRAILVIFVVATILQSVANGLMAVCAGLLGQALAGQQLATLAVDAERLALTAPTALPVVGMVHAAPFTICLVGFAAALVKACAGALSTYGQKRAAFQAGNALRQGMTEAILQCGQPPTAAAASHAAIAIRLRDVERGIDEGIFASVRAVAHVVPLLIGLVLLSSRMAIVAIATLLPFGLALSHLRHGIRRGHARASKLAEELHAGVDELLRHLDLWRTYGAGWRVQRALARTGEEAARASARAEATRAALSGANEALGAAALLIAVALVERGDVPLGQGSLVAFAAVFFLMYRPLREFGDARSVTDRGAQALAALSHSRAELEGAVGSAPVMHTVMGKSCTTAWRPERLDVREVTVERDDAQAAATTFFAAPGEIIVIIGPTGSGKTTLLRALLGLERGARGSIRYGERELIRAGVGPDARPFAWVPQEAAIVSGTLEDNIALGAPASSADEATIHARLEGLGASPLLARVAGARLHAGGHELSGGERQWVAIARALETGLPVLLLDEPTSGLDPLSQERVLAVLAGLRGKRTVILVTHRPEPLALADRIIRLGEAETDLHSSA